MDMLVVSITTADPISRGSSETSTQHVRERAADTQISSSRFSLRETEQHEAACLDEDTRERKQADDQ